MKTFEYKCVATLCEGERTIRILNHIDGMFGVDLGVALGVGGSLGLNISW